MPPDPPTLLGTNTLHSFPPKPKILDRTLNYKSAGLPGMTNSSAGHPSHSGQGVCNGQSKVVGSGECSGSEGHGVTGVGVGDGD